MSYVITFVAGAVLGSLALHLGYYQKVVADLKGDLARLGNLNK